MARVTYGGGVTEFKGSVGGVTFQRNYSGPIVKLKTYYPNNPSAVQSVQQSNLARLVATWPTLSSSVRAAWNTLAATYDHTTPWGESKSISGYQWFISCSLNLLASDQPVFTASPTYISVANPDQFSLDTDVNGLYLHWSPAYTPPYNFLIISVSPPLRQGNINIRRSLFQLIVSNTSPITEIDITSEFESYFNVTWSTFWSNSTCHIIARVRCIAEDEGFSSAYTSDITFIS